ncbi:GNAT family N-acetyltransferase [Sporolactobacillus sp. CPB3-1]|uniref:GNAT family N-acetyltransferase n=1 Tax=Sporolactobacillus mangiferae TaxID=2940498 RepID=A0ABT0MBK8_9BACL|nr:GNAT family N-acetyltransferase [Sporolactobacillus mangiferae]MCL1631978.1 GNAT family N-acetyltransferase [Sporolactobacillus mangiferae]
MIRAQKKFTGSGGINYIIRSACPDDAKRLSEIRVQIDGETQNMDRESGEQFIDEQSFRQLIKEDTESDRNLFLVASIDHIIVGFSRCQGNHLKRFAHKVEFGVCILRKYWGLGIGTHLLKESIAWAESNTIKKMTLTVLETNEKAVGLYRKFGFEIEGVLKKDKLLSDGRYYNTIVMGRVSK